MVRDEAMAWGMGMGHYNAAWAMGIMLVRSHFACYYQLAMFAHKHTNQITNGPLWRHVQGTAGM